MIVEGNVTHGDNPLEHNEGKYPEEVHADETKTNKETNGTRKNHAGNH